MGGDDVHWKYASGLYTDPWANPNDVGSHRDLKLTYREGYARLITLRSQALVLSGVELCSFKLEKVRWNILCYFFLSGPEYDLVLNISRIIK